MVKVGNYEDAEHVEKCWSPVLFIIILLFSFIIIIVLIVAALIFLFWYFWDKKLNKIEVKVEVIKEAEKEKDANEKSCCSTPSLKGLE